MSNIEVVRTPEIIAGEINAIKVQTARMMLVNAVEIGRRLTEAKSLVPHGSFGAWLKENVAYSERTAENLMLLCEKYGADQSALFGDSLKTKSIADLSPTKALALLGIEDEKEREEFVKKEKPADLSVAELKAKIKQLQKEKDVANRELNKLSDENVAVRKKLASTKNELEGAMEEVERLEGELAKPVTVEAKPVEADAEGIARGKVFKALCMKLQEEVNELVAMIEEEFGKDADRAAVMQKALSGLCKGTVEVVDGLGED